MCLHLADMLDLFFIPSSQEVQLKFRRFLSDGEGEDEYWEKTSSLL